MFMNTVRKIFLSALAVSCVSAMIRAQENAVEEIPTSRLELKNFPKTDVPEAVYKNVEKSYLFAENGTCEFRRKTELRVNTLFAVNELCGETFVVYNPKFQRVKINAAYTVMADGVTRVDVPENAFNTVLPACAADAPAFNFLRELVITHTALEPGATIFLDYSVFYSAETSMLFDEYADMPFPCERLVMSFNGSTTELFNVPARSREKYFTAQKSVPVIYPGMPAMPPRDLCATEEIDLGDSGKKRLSALLKKDMKESEKRTAIVRFVQEQIATVPIPSDLLLESDLRDSEEVLQSAYGTPLEKARVLWWMLTQTFGDDFRIVHNASEDVFSVESDSGSPIFINAGKTLPESINLNAFCEWANGKERICGTATCSSDDSCTDAKEIADAWFGKGAENLKAKRLPENRLSIEFERSVPARAGTLLWRVPVAEKGIASSDFKTLSEERKSELKIPVHGETFSEKYSYTMRVPEGWMLAGGLQASEVKTPFGSALFFVAQDGAEITVRKELSLDKTVVSAEEYPKFRSLISAWFAPANNRLLFVEKTEAEAEKEKGS